MLDGNVAMQSGKYRDKGFNFTNSGSVSMSLYQNIYRANDNSFPARYTVQMLCLKCST